MDPREAAIVLILLHCVAKHTFKARSVFGGKLEEVALVLFSIGFHLFRGDLDPRLLYVAAFLALQLSR